jgi:hypothetical protein
MWSRILWGPTPVAGFTPGSNHDLCHDADDVTPVAGFTPDCKHVIAVIQRVTSFLSSVPFLQWVTSFLLGVPFLTIATMNSAVTLKALRR